MGKLIVFEGLDCSGKETQAKKLKENLEKRGFQVGYFSFPNYESPIGKFIAGPFLGRDGYEKRSFQEKSTEVDAKISAMLYAMDRYSCKRALLEDMSRMDFVIVNRYVYSNMAYQGCKVKENEVDEFLSFIQTLEFELLGMPKADMIFYLDVPVSLLGDFFQKRASLDDNEKDLAYLTLCQQFYQRIKRQFSFQEISCVQDKMQLKTPEEIALLIDEVMTDFIKSF